jgi:aerobactin synthase
MSDCRELYFKLNLNLIIKSIEELSFEEVLSIKPKNDGNFELSLENVKYTFRAKKGIWNNFHLIPGSIEKIVGDKKIDYYTAADFFIEVQQVAQIPDKTLAGYIEEANQTIYSDQLLNRHWSKLRIEDLLNFSFIELEQILPGHPKIIMNKGRIGWGQDEIKKYAPESRSSFQLFWTAIANKELSKGVDEELQDWIMTLFSEQEKKLIDTKVPRLDRFQLIPVHPWQWQRFIISQYFESIQEGVIIPLGIMGPKLTPQSSIRTLSFFFSKKFDLKLSLSILNTSCIRGLPLKYTEIGYDISRYLEQVIVQDQVLSGMELLKEVGSYGLKHKDFEKISQCSYHYKEFLGCVWRESVTSKLEKKQWAIPTSSLLFQLNNESFIAEIIKRSGLSVKNWLKSYFEVVLVPLYHLQMEHGLGLVAHGQNIILILEGYRPKKVVIKDFQGDLRVSIDSKHLAQNGGNLSLKLDRLPPEYLIHDLITGHILSLMRYLSRVVSDKHLMSEQDFYCLMGETIHKYEQKQNWRKVKKSLLLRPEFEKILVNRVRFAIGYSESQERPKPSLGTSLINPMYKAFRDE